MGFLGLFGGGKPQVELAVDRPAVLPGDTVAATVRVTGDDKDASIEEGRLELVCVVKYTYRYRSQSRTGSTTQTSTAEEATVVQRERFLERGTVAARSFSSHALELAVPRDAIPSSDGRITSVWWEVRAILSRRRANDAEAKERVRVLARAEDGAPRAAEVDSHDDLELGLRLDRHAFGPGDTIEGTLVARALADCDVTEVRVELERFEEVPRDAGNEERAIEVKAPLAEETSFAQGDTQEFPFSIPVPPAFAPTLQTGYSSIRWLLRGVGSRRMRSDYNVVLELTVYTEGPQVPARRPM